MKNVWWRVLVICIIAVVPAYLGVYTLIEHKNIFFNKISGYALEHNTLNENASVMVAIAYFLAVVIILLLLYDNKISKLLMQFLGVIAAILFIASAYVNNI